jgi:hypothetical protein
MLTRQRQLSCGEAGRHARAFAWQCARHR